MTDIILLIFGLITVVSAALAVFHPHIVYAAFSLMLTFFGVAGLYVFLQADFVAGVQVLIYVGGILILFLFAIMLSHKLFGSPLRDLQKKLIPALGLSLPIFFIIAYVIFSTNWNLVSQTGQNETVSSLGHLILDQYILPFELASILLLGALIGAVYLVRSSDDK
ncbi:MAG: NADH-quinone oxidoreductase subunit J [Deltaproteobacteria bacterium]|nr:NADH-quinone oxidoreductase subunit J [Deltaproteobacteria bacterium]